MRFIFSQIVLIFSPILAAGHLRLPWVSALLPFRLAIYAENSLILRFHPLEYASRRNLPYVKIPFRLSVDPRTLVFTLKLSVFSASFQILNLESSTHWETAGKCYFKTREGQKSISWDVGDARSDAFMRIGKTATGTDVKVVAEDLHSLTQIISQYSTPNFSPVANDLKRCLIRRKKDLANPIWIIGNASSVRNEDLDRIPKSSAIIAMNRFHLSYANHTLREDFTISSDPLVVKNFGEQIIQESSGLPVFLTENSNEIHSKEVIQIRLRRERRESVHFGLNNGLSDFGSSLISSLQIAMILGFKNIRLYGIEMDFFTDTFALADGRIQRGGSNHFIPNYRENKSWSAPDWIRFQHGLVSAAVAATALGVEIRNYSRQGKLAFFDAGQFDDIIEG